MPPSAFVLFLWDSFSGELLTVALTFLCFGALVILFMRFGVRGLLAYIVLGTVVSNIQVLKTAVLQTTDHPMVLGTVIFTSLFWAMELVTEHEGPEAAREILYLSFVMPLLMLVWMVVTIAYKPVPSSDNMLVQRALETLFLPAPALFCASLIAYFVSQWVDIWIFSALKRLTQGRLLALRATVPVLVSGFVDNALFSILAWKVFGIQSITLSALFWTYIVGAYGLRAFLSLGAAPLLHTTRVLMHRGWFQKIHRKELVA